MSRTEIFTMPSASISCINADNNLLLNPANNNTFLLGIDSRGFINYKFGSENNKQEISYISIVGETTKNRTCFNTNQYQNTNDYILGQGINTRNGDNSLFIDHSNFSYTLLSKIGEGCNTRIEIGLNENIQTGIDGRLKGGWFKCDPRNYLGYGFEGFSNPFIWNKRTTGVSMGMEFNNLKMYSSYGTKQQYAAQDNSPTPPTNEPNNYGNGFISSNTPSICSCGISYESSNDICEGGISLVLQNINEGSQIVNDKDPKYWTVENTQNTDNDVFSTGSITTKAASSLIQHVKNNSKNTQSCTGLVSMKMMKNLEINCSCTMSKFDTTQGENVTLSKWSLGCSSQSRSFVGNSLGQCKNQFGINIGTPTYLKSGSQSELTPTVCEFSCLLNMYGFNIPLYIDYFNNKVVGSPDYKSLSSYPTNDAVGNTCIFGIRPNKIFGYVIQDNMIQNKEKTIIPCNLNNQMFGVEGSLLDGNEDENEDVSE